MLTWTESRYCSARRGLRRNQAAEGGSGSLCTTRKLGVVWVLTDGHIELVICSYLHDLATRGTGVKPKMRVPALTIAAGAGFVIGVWIHYRRVGESSSRNDGSCTQHVDSLPEHNKAKKVEEDKKEAIEPLTPDILRSRIGSEDIRWPHGVRCRNNSS